ncbi:hypothetical protein [Wenzhouxiangella sp. EGI_FJ10305]|uniref:hypothetical protein n=1 Tax=Wenzhouxiangella sp. EGI_FJ10305 TaxID=3243768 RepID=UPI0035DBA2E6
MSSLVNTYFKIFPWLARAPIRSGLVSGLALGLFDREDFHYLDQLNAGRSGKWSSERHNLRGLLPWERDAIRTWFPASGRLLITAVGGGREVLALEPMGYELEAFECNLQLAEAANQHLRNRGFRSRVSTCPRDSAPQVDGMFDGIIVGWGSYTLVMGRDTRIAFLQALSQSIPEGAPLLLSYFKRENPPVISDRVQHKIASWIRRLRDASCLDENDVMDWNFRHRFNDDEIESELAAAGFRAVHISDEDYPHAVGIRQSMSDF